MRLQNRRPAPPPLLRPPRRSLRPFLIALAFCLVGAVGGIVIGLRLQPPPLPENTAGSTAAPPTASLGSPPAGTGPTTSSPAPPAATAHFPSGSDLAALNAQLAAVRRTLEQEQARLEALTRARTTAEAQLAALQREVAAAQREAAVQQSPPTIRREPATPPASARPPRTEATTGQPRVYVHHRAGSGAGAEAAAALLGPLREGGFEVPEVRASPAVPSPAGGALLPCR
jgi:hypothetical protein